MYVQNSVRSEGLGGEFPGIAEEGYNEECLPAEKHQDAFIDWR